MNLKSHAQATINTHQNSPSLFRELNRYNLILDSDSYKFSHWKQYPEGAHGYSGYVESRGGVYSETVFFGLQYVLKKYLTQPITQQDIDEAEKFATAHGEPFNREGWEYILKEHQGMMPIRIKAVKEGTVVPTKNVLMVIESTDEKVFWLPSFLETMLLRAVWFPTTVATISYQIKKLLSEFHLMTAGNTEGVPFSLHDFGARGTSSFESSAIGGAAHLVNFLGSDTVAGVRLANICYGTKDGMSGYSIPATEHSTMTSWGREREADAYRNLLEVYGGDGKILACVSDSYDIYNAIDNIWGKQLKQAIIDSGSTLVIRPDSGDPVTVVSKCIQLADDNFGHTLNEKGFKVLNHVKLIQGDGVNPDSIKDILVAITEMGYCATNLAFGMGGALLQKLDRDTQKFALKCSAIQIDGVWHDVYKEPVTSKMKVSKKGQLELFRRPNGELFTDRDTAHHPDCERQLITIFENGQILKEWTFDEVRANASL